VSAAAAGLGLTVLFPAHPRTQKRLQEFGLNDWLAALPQVRMVDAVGYLDFLALLANAALIFTDSGGVQQEACILHVPCVTLRGNTEWTETLEVGANRLTDCDPERILAGALEAMASRRDWPVPFGDGTAAARIVDLCERVVEETMRDPTSSMTSSALQSVHQRH